MRCTKYVSEANGFEREEMQSNIKGLVEVSFDEETEEAWTVILIKDEVLHDLFQLPFFSSEINLGYY